MKGPSVPVLVDDRVGSADLVGHLRHWGCPVEKTRLEYGDAAFAGNGRDGAVSVGVEVKKTHDALNCMGDGRFAGHQLPGLLSNYDRIWLVVEGNYRPDFGTGLLLAPGERRKEVVTGAKRHMYRDLDNWLTSMEVLAGVRVRRTGDRYETARFVADLYGWWQKEWSDHKSHHAIHDDWGSVVPLTKPNLARRFAAQLPGIGYEKSGWIVKSFPSVQAMVGAAEKEWVAVPGIGKTLAKRIWDAIRQG
jgi:ERCC4-type nuclease